MGVPVITLAGSTYVSRGVGLLPQRSVALIAASAWRRLCEKAAASLASDGGKLAYFHKTLRYNMRPAR